ncbi:MAG: hypothetical protein AB7N91_07820 [Candidatus Tectimicrobiota bacterium]
MLRTFGKTVGSAFAVLCLVSTLAVAAEEKGMEMSCMKSDGKGQCTVGTMPDGKELVLVGSGMKEGDKMLCHHRDNMIHCVPAPPKK